MRRDEEEISAGVGHMTGGLEVAMTPWAGAAPLIEGMRQIEVTSKADKVLPPGASKWLGFAE